MKKITVEPFLRYPASVIDSKDKAIQVIKKNGYYFYVIGAFALLSGSYLIYIQKNIEDLRFGLATVLTGIIYVFLTFLVNLFKTRIACWLLAIYLVYIMVSDIYINGFKINIFRIILCLAVYRMIKATNYLNTLKQ